MFLIKKTASNKVIASSSTTIHEYLMDEPAISGAVAKINGRYPEAGFAVNQESKELAFVISGNGYVVSPSSKHAITIGDVIFVKKGERFAWEGTLTVFMVTTPRFDPKQHQIIYE